MRTKTFDLGLALGAVLAATIAAAPARADEACAEECYEARRVCHHAGYHARVACVTQCAEVVEQAFHRARQTCELLDLDREACLALVREAVEAATEACQGDCRRAYRRARRFCGEEIRECLAACQQELDPDCVLGCREEFAGCREELGGCVHECAAQTRADVEACFDRAANTCEPDGLLACIRHAFAEGSRCAHGCYEQWPCGTDLRECLGGCAVEPE